MTEGASCGGSGGLALAQAGAYLREKSPFGLIDTVGNAGDWAIATQSSYERIYMGATYKYNPEDATTFRVLPITDSDYMVREIMARCVDGPPILSDEMEQQKKPPEDGDTQEK